MARDFTKYEFEGKTYSKMRLVSAVVKRHMQTNPNLSAAELMAQFEPIRTNTVQTVNFVRSQNRRHLYCDMPGETIKTTTDECVTLIHWTLNDIEKFIAGVESWGYIIKKVEK